MGMAESEKKETTLGLDVLLAEADDTHTYAAASDVWMVIVVRRTRS